MSPTRRAEELVLAWARTYTRGLAEPARQRRLAELTSDCHEQRRWGDEVGASPVAVATSMVARTLAGMPADLLWRQGQLATSRDRSLNPRGRPMGRWIKDNWWVGLATLAGAMFTAAGVMFPFEGEVEGGLPWWGGMLLMLAFGALLLGGVWYRRRNRVAGDWMIVVGTLPLYPLFWTIILPVLGLLIAVPAILDTADAQAVAATAGETHTPAPAARDRITIVLLVVLVVATATSLLAGQADVAYALVSPVLAVFAGHLIVRSAAFPPLRRLGLTAFVAGMVHALLTVAVVLLGDDGVIELGTGLPSVSNALMSIAGTVGLVLFLFGGRFSRDQARPA